MSCYMEQWTSCTEVRTEWIASLKTSIIEFKGKKKIVLMEFITSIPHIKYLIYTQIKSISIDQTLTWILNTSSTYYFAKSIKKPILLNVNLSNQNALNFCYPKYHNP